MFWGNFILKYEIKFDTSQVCQVCQVCSKYPPFLKYIIRSVILRIFFSKTDLFKQHIT